MAYAAPTSASAANTTHTFINDAVNVSKTRYEATAGALADLTNEKVQEIGRAHV